MGFGRDLVTKQYKIIKVFNPELNEYFLPELCEIFTLDSNPWASWKIIGLVPYKIDLSATPVHINGAIYWFTDVIYHPFPSTIIVMFDIHKEKFEATPQPSCCSNPTRPRSLMQLGSLRGCLCLAEQESDTQLNIWIMEEMINASPDEVKSTVTWKKIFGINLLLIDPQIGLRFSIAERKDGILLICGCGDKMYLYDPKSKNLTFASHGRDQFLPITFTESLVPLYGHRLEPGT